VRIVFGSKALFSRAVFIPDGMSKFDLMPLAGGYRATSVMQIWADVYCYTQYIIRELGRCFPEPMLFRKGSEGLVFCAESGLADFNIYISSGWDVWRRLARVTSPKRWWPRRLFWHGRATPYCCC